jgi:PAS domain S-box-containing protein
MTVIPRPLLGDVSCRTTGYTIQHFQQNGISPAVLTRGMTQTLAELQVHSASIPWDDYLLFITNTYQNLTPEQTVQLCVSYKGSKHLRPLLSAAGLWFNPAKYFEWVANPKTGAIQQLFRCIETNLFPVNERELLLEETVQPGFSLPPDFFWESQSIAFSVLTTYFGLAPAIVNWEPIERGARFKIHLPRRRPIRFLFSWIGSWFQRNLSEDVQSALAYGHERSIRLEQEIAERKLIEAKLQESERRFHEITNSMPGVVYRYVRGTDGSEKFTYLSGGIVVLTGYTAEEISKNASLMWECVHPEHVQHLRESVEFSAKTKKAWEEEFQLIAKDGTMRWVRGKSSPEQENRTGKVVWNGIFTDITKEKNAAETLRNTELQLSEVTNNLPGMLFQIAQLISGDIHFSYISHRITAILGYSDEILLDPSWQLKELLHPDDRERALKSIQTAAALLGNWTFEGRVLRSDGIYVWLRMSANPTQKETGEILWSGVALDVSLEKAAEAELQEKNSRLEALTTNSVAFIRELDRDGIIKYANRTTSGGPVEELVGKCMLDFLSEADRPHGLKMLERVFEHGEVIYSEFSVAMNPEQPRQYTVAIAPIWLDNQVNRAVLTSFDITEKNLAEAKLRLRDELLRKLSEQVPGVIYQYHRWPDGKHCFPYASERIRDIYQVTPEEVRESADAVIEKIHADDLQMVVDSIQFSMENLEPWRCEYRVILPERGIRWLDGHGIPERQSDGSTMWHGYIRDVTRRKRAEVSLRESESRFRSLIQDLDVGVVLQDANDQILISNPAAARVLGLTEEQLRGITSKDPRWGLIQEDGSDFPADLIPSVLAAKTLNPVRNALVGVKDFDSNDRIWLQVSANPRVDNQGNLLHVLVTLVEVTERKLADEQRRLSEFALSRASVAFVVVGRDAKILQSNEANCRMTGYSEAELTQMLVTDVSPGFPFENWDDHWADLREKKQLQFETCLRRKNGEIFSVDLELNYLEFEGREYNFAFARDISERKRSEAALLESEERLLSVIENAPNVAIQFYDRSGHVRLWNSASERMFGFPSEFAIGKTLDQLILTAEGFIDFLKTLETIQQTGQAIEPFEFHFVRSDGSSRYCLSSLFRIPGTDQSDWFVCMDVDITERKDAERALQENTRRLAVAFEATSDAIWEWNYQTGETYYSSRWYEMLGCDPNTPMTFETWKSLCHPDDYSAAIDTIRGTLESSNAMGYATEFRMKHSNGEWIWILGRGNVVDRDTAGQPRMLAGTNTDITERKRAEKAVLDSEMRYRTLIETSSDAIFVLELNGKIRSANRAAVEMHGYDRSQLLSMHMQDLDLPDAVAKIPERMERLQNGEVLTFQVMHRRHDGSIFPVEVVASSVEIDGECLVLAFDRDITKRKEAESALLEAERRQRLALDAGQMGTWEWDLGTDRLVWDQTQEEIFGYQPGAFDQSLTTFKALIFQEDLTAIETVLADAIDGKDFVGEFRIRRLDGEIRWIHGNGAMIPAKDGRHARLVGINYDITARKNAEQALLEEKTLLQALFDSLPGIVFAFDQSGRYLRWNHNYERWLGWTDAEMGQITVLMTVAEQHREHVSAVIQEVFEKGESSTELNALAKDGREVPLFCTGVRVSLNGKPCVVGFGIDITRRLATEKALRLSESRLTEAQRIARLGYWEADLQTGITWWSDEEYRIFGVNPEAYQPSQEAFFKSLHPDDREKHETALNEMLETGTFTPCQFRIIRPDGTERYVYEEARIVQREGIAPLLHGVTRDVTEKAQADMALRASLHEKEALLKEIHHRVKNNLQVISSLLNLQASRVTHPIASEVLAESQNRVRAMALVHETLYRSDDLARVDIARYLEELCGYLFRSFGVDSNRIILRLNVTHVVLSLDRAIPCGLIVNEIVSNSLKYAFPENRVGTVTVELHLNSNETINMAISDDGIGLPSDLVVDQTPSLGLQLVCILTEQLGGHLTLDRSHGTRFEISFIP